MRTDERVDPAAVSAVRAFNRFYTRQIGLLEEGYLQQGVTLTQARILYELANGGATTAAELARLLSLDEGYLSRLVRAFVDDGLVSREAAEEDARRRILSLTDRGRAAFSHLDRLSSADVEATLAALPATGRRRMVAAMTEIHDLLDPAHGTTPWTIRGTEPGDLGWVVKLHGEVYAAEYGWHATFEGLVAEIVGRFAQQHDPARERCWIAERHGRPVGSVFCVRRSDEVAQLRLLLVDPLARGQGIGRGLVDACLGFARDAGYRRIMLWTNDVLVSARRIYESVGFRLVEEEPHHSFGHDLVGQTWEREL